MIKDPDCKNLHFTTPLQLTPRAALQTGKKPTGQTTLTTGKGQLQGAEAEAEIKRRREQSERDKAKRKQPPPAPVGGPRVKKKRKAAGAGAGAAGIHPDQVSKTPDGQPICFAYNNGENCNESACRRTHCCQYRGCHEKHPIRACPKALAAGIVQPLP